MFGVVGIRVQQASQKVAGESHSIWSWFY